MVVDTNKESININKLVCDKEEVIEVEGDMIVPDSKPDILSAISTSGNICIYKKELMNENLKLDGSINTYVMYIAENGEDKVRGLNVSLDFSKLISTPNCNDDMMLNVTTEIKSINCNVINGRKVKINASINVKIKVYSNENIEMINEILNNDDIQVLRNNIKVNSLVGCGSTKAYVKDTISIDSSDNLIEILNVNINMVDRDVKTSYNKVLTKTEAELKIMYLTEDNRIVTITNRIPIVGFVDIQNVNDDNICDTNFEIRNMIIKTNNAEEHSIYVEIEVEVGCMAYEEKELELLQDFYCPIQELTCTKREILAMAQKENRVETCNINETVNIPGLNGGQLIDANCLPKITNTNKFDSKVMYEGELEIKFIFESTDTGINTGSYSVPFEFEVTNIANGNALDLTTNLEIANQSFDVKSNGDVTANVDVVFNMNMSRNEKVNVIEDIELSKDRASEDYSLIIYIVKPGDTLWSIAKKLGSTIEDIAKANAIENENMINVGEKLYIPRYTRKGASKQVEMPTMMYA